MSKYTVVAGDTFGLISVKKYGSSADSWRILNANPGSPNPPQTGSVLNIPAPNTPRDIPQKAPSENQDEVSMLIDGKRFRFFTDINIKKSVDSISTVTFRAPFDPENKGLRELFKPLTFKQCEVTVGGDPFFKGTLMSPIPSGDGKQNIVTVSGYGLPGVLGDCMTTVTTSQNLEFNNQNLRQISSALADMFGLVVEFTSDPGPAFERVSLEIGQKVLPFLIKLGKERGLISRDTQFGRLLFYRPDGSFEPVAQFREASTPVLSVTPSFNDQEFYSHVTGFDPVMLGLEGGQATEANPLLKGVVRPYNYKAVDSESGDLKISVKGKTGRMFAGVVSYSVPVDTWRGQGGALWFPGQTVTLKAPNRMIYSDYKFMIDAIDFDKKANSKTATLKLILPGARAGILPGVFPWED